MFSVYRKWGNSERNCRGASCEMAFAACDIEWIFYLSIDIECDYSK